MERATMLHVTNGEATRFPLERSGVPGTVESWDAVLFEDPAMRSRQDPLQAAGAHEEVVFWFEHDLHDQLLLIRHLAWLAQPEAPRTRYSIVIGTDYLGLLKPEQFLPKFAARRPITPEEIATGADAWAIYCGDDPRRLMVLAEDAGPLVYLPRALRRLLEELPAERDGLARSERQILDVLSQGDRTPEQLFVAAARLEDDIWMGDLTFWTIVRRLAAGPHPLVALRVDEAAGRLPDGTVAITGAGRQVLAGRADHMRLNAPSRRLGGTPLSPERDWRWTGSSVRPPSP
jgi:hypothetical protein